MIYLITPERGFDNMGSGHYGAKRGKRLHKGVDFSAWPGSKVLSTVSGEVTKIGFPYNPEDPIKGFLRYVEIKLQREFYVRFFYISPCVKPGDKVELLQIIGKVQDLRKVYGNEMTPHIHVEVMDSNRQHINPISFFCRSGYGI